MRILILTIFFIFTSNFNLYPQWSNDPNNNLIVGYGLNPELCSDSAGGCYITYEAGYPAELYLHRVDMYGYQPWGDKRIIAGELEEQKSAKIIEDGEGGVIVSYGDHILHDSYRLRIQKVDSSGNLLWGSTGQRVSLVDTGQSVQRLVTDGDGGCVIVWMESNFGFAEYRINRIDRNGQRVWSNSGIYIQSDYNYSPPNLVRASDGSYYLQIRENLYRLNRKGEIIRQDSVSLGSIIPDPEGGVVLSGRVGSINNRKLVAQRQDSIGNHLWQEPYVEIGDSLHINTHLNIQHSNDYYYYSWVGKKNGLNNRAQFQALRKDGSLLFLNGSELLSSDSAISKMGIIPSHFSRVIFCWNIPGIINTTYSQLYDTLSNKLWNKDGVIVAYPNILYQSFTTDGRGGFIVAGLINDFTVVVQQVSKNGYLGEIITNVTDDDKKLLNTEFSLKQNYPNPFNSTTVISYQLPVISNVTLKVYDILGNDIATLVNEEKQPGVYEVEFDASMLASGIYLYQLLASGFVQTNKMILEK